MIALRSLNALFTAPVRQGDRSLQGRAGRGPTTGPNPEAIDPQRIGTFRIHL
jgi:hypothetical protein